jgi:hypothetical protein
MVTAKVNAPSYQAYEPTRLEQIFAEHMADPLFGGSAAVMLNHYGMDRAAGIDKYQKALSDSNALQVALARQEMDTQLREAGLKEIAPITNAGVQVGQIPDIARLFTGGATDDQTLAASKASLDLKLAQALEARAKAAHAGDAMAPQSDVQIQQDPSGRIVGVISSVKGKSGDVVGMTAANAARLAYGPLGANDGRGPPDPQHVLRFPSVAATRAGQNINPNVTTTPQNTMTFAPRPQ